MRSLCVLLLAWLVPFTLAGQKPSFVSTDRNVLGSAEELTASLTFVDVDGDTDLDVVFANGRHWAQTNEVYLNNGVGQFTVGYPLGPEKATTYAVPAGDLDGDGDADIIVANDRAENWVYLNNGAGHFRRAWSVGPDVEPARSAQLYDLDRNGALDVLVTNRGTANGFYLNDGTGHFGPKREFGNPDGSTIAVAVGDVDGDGDPDLVLANRDGQANHVLLNDGALGFGERRPFGTGSDETRSVALADLNGDGILDIVAANIGEPNGLYLGKGDGSFQPETSFGGSEQSYGAVVTDVDQDGDEDIVIANVRDRNAVYLNPGTAGGEWDGMWLGEEAATTYGLAAGDLTGDGYPELGFANSGSLNRLFMNLGTRRDDNALRSPETYTVALRYLGTAGWEISASERTSDSPVVLVDLYLTRAKYAAPEVWDPADTRPEYTRADTLFSDTEVVDAQIDRADFILVQHGHPDHVMDVPYLAHRTGAVVIGHETVINIMRAYGVPDSQLITVRGGEDYDFGDVSVRVIPSLHSPLNDKRYYQSETVEPGAKRPLRIN